MSASAGPIEAAGGVVVAEGLVLVVHRPSTDDWTFPKGKREPKDGDLITCAIREVQEETGFLCAPQERSLLVRYVMPNGLTKEVTLWRMSVVSGQFTVNDEVDDGRWVSPEVAGTLLTYDSDRVALGHLVP